MALVLTPSPSEGCRQWDGAGDGAERRGNKDKRSASRNRQPSFYETDVGHASLSAGVLIALPLCNFWAGVDDINRLAGSSRPPVMQAKHPAAHLSMPGAEQRLSRIVRMGKG